MSSLILERTLFIMFHHSFQDKNPIFSPCGQYDYTRPLYAISLHHFIHPVVNGFIFMRTSEIIKMSIRKSNLYNWITHYKFTTEIVPYLFIQNKIVYIRNSTNYQALYSSKIDTSQSASQMNSTTKINRINSLRNFIQPN